MGWDSQTMTITVNTVDRIYKRAYVSKYATALKNNNTVTMKCDITDGVSYLRVSHEEVKGVARHLFSLEDEWTDSNGNEHFVKTHVVLTHTAGDADEETALELLVAGHAVQLHGAGNITSALIDGEL